MPLLCTANPGTAASTPSPGSTMATRPAMRSSRPLKKFCGYVLRPATGAASAPPTSRLPNKTGPALCTLGLTRRRGLQCAWYVSLAGKDPARPAWRRAEASGAEGCQREAMRSSGLERSDLNSQLLSLSLSSRANSTTAARPFTSADSMVWPQPQASLPPTSCRLIAM